MTAKFYSVRNDTVTTEETTFTSYGLSLLTQDKHEYIFKDISTDYDAVNELGKRIIASDIAEVHFKDIIDDFIALEADVSV